MLPNPRLNLVGSVFVTGFIPTRFAPLHVFFRTMDTGLGNFLWLSGQKRNEYNNHPVNNQMSWKTNYTCPQNVQAVIILKVEFYSKLHQTLPHRYHLRSSSEVPKSFKEHICLFYPPSFPPPVVHFLKWESSFDWPHPNNIAK